MGKGPEQTFFQRRYYNCHQLHEKVLNITNYQRNAIQNHYEISPPPVKGLFSKRQEITNAGKGVEKREPLYTVGGNVTWCSHYGNQNGSYLKNFKCPHNPPPLQQCLRPPETLWWGACNPNYSRTGQVTSDLGGQAAMRVPATPLAEEVEGGTCAPNTAKRRHR